MAIDVVGVGLAVIDLKVTVSSVPKPEEVVLAYDYHKHHGGPVANALVTLQRLGMKTRYMGKFGDDEYGHIIIDGMNAEGIDTSSVQLAKGETSAFSIVMVDSETKARAIAFHAGCGLTVPADCIDPEAIKSARLLHVDFHTPAVRAACEVAQREGIPISVDVDGLFPGLEELLEMASIFISSNDVASALVGEEDPLASARSVLKQFNLDVAGVTCGKEGSIIITPKETVRVPGFQIDVADTTGAGGVYKGAYLYGHLNGWPIRQTARFANAAAALMCSGMNGWADIPTLKHVEDFLRKHDSSDSC